MLGDVLRLLLLWLALSACAEAKNQLRLGIGGTGSSQAPKQPGDLRTTPAGAATNAGLAVGAAIGASVASRAVGGCYAACPPGTGCNEATGLCDTRPCRDLCRADEVCQNDRCVPLLLPNLKINQSR